MSLDKSTYYDIIKLTTLTSIDLIFIYNNKVLVGLRNNNPAKGTILFLDVEKVKMNLLKMVLFELLKKKLD